MIEQNFRVSRTVGEGRSRAADVVRLRKALRKTGHSRPAPQPSGVYDRSAQDAVLRFQRDFGLHEDGVIRPGGPTQSAINIAHAALDAGGREGYETVREPFAALHKAGLRYRPDDESPRAPGRWVDMEGRAVPPGRIQDHLRRGVSGPVRTAHYQKRDPVTGRPLFPGQRGMILEGGGGGGGGRGSIRGSDVIKGLIQHLFGNQLKEAGPGNAERDNSGPARRSAPPASPPTQIPPTPAEPPPEPKKGREQLEPEKGRPFIFPGAVPVESHPSILIYPDQSDLFDEPQIVEAGRGDDRTREFNERVRDWFLTPERIKEGWVHEAGGREQRPGIGHNSGEKPEDGDLGEAVEKPEEYIPNPAKDFEEEGETIDGRKGSKFPDLTFYNKNTKKRVRIQTVDTDKNGKPTQRELDNAWAIWKRTGATVLLIRKPW